MELLILLLVTTFIIFVISAALEGNFVPVLIIVRFIRLVIWLEIVNKVNNPSSDKDDYCQNFHTLNYKTKSIEALRALLYIVAYIGFFPYDLVAYRSLSLIVIRISIMAGIAYFVNSLKLLSYKEKTPRLLKRYLWTLPLKEVVLITSIDFLCAFFLSPWIEFFINKS